MKYAFFDLDHTLIPVDSSGLWSYFLLKFTGKEDPDLLKERLQYDVDYYEGTLDINKFEDFEMRLLARFSRKEADRLRDEFIEKAIKPKIVPAALKLIEDCKKAGARVVMVTATYRYVVEPIGELLGIKDIIAAQQEEDDWGEFTGRWLWHVFGDGKIREVQKYLAERGEKLSVLAESAFFTDSINDLPLMEFVASHGGQAVATNPDKKLRKIAEERGWKIIDIFDIEIATP